MGLELAGILHFIILLPLVASPERTKTSDVGRVGCIEPGVHRGRVLPGDVGRVTPIEAHIWSENRIPSHILSNNGLRLHTTHYTAYHRTGFNCETLIIANCEFF